MVSSVHQSQFMINFNFKSLAIYILNVGIKTFGCIDINTVPIIIIALFPLVYHI